MPELSFFECKTKTFEQIFEMLRYLSRVEMFEIFEQIFEMFEIFEQIFEMFEIFGQVNQGFLGDNQSLASRKSIQV